MLFRTKLSLCVCSFLAEESSPMWKQSFSEELVRKHVHCTKMGKQLAT